MKKFTNVARCIAYTVVLMVFGCVEDPELDKADNGANETSLTRANHEEKFYYAFDEKIPLYEVANRMVVTFDKEHRASAEEQIMKNTQISKENLQIREGYSDDFSVITLNDSSDKRAFRDDLTKQTGVKSVRQVYALDDGYEMGYHNEIIVQFKEGASQQEIAEMYKKFDLEIIKTYKLHVLLSVPVDLDPLDVANAYQESGLVNYSHPNFIVSASLYQSLPSDPYFNNQFYLRNTGQGVNGRTSTAGADINVVNAWAITKGDPDIVVAVIDYDGFTLNHPDMPNMLTGRNYGSGGLNNYSASGNNNHGNACAGIIGATHNNGIGIAGIAPNCKILPIKMSTTGPSDWAAAIEFAADNADVISCSCGIPDSRWQLSTNPNLHPVVVDAIRYATTHGRRGSKGSVVVFAASNSANHVGGNNGLVAFPANVNVSGVLTVGAVDRYGRQANYSPTSNPSSTQNQIIDVVAPSHRAYSTQIPSETFDVWSIDIPGTAGYNSVHETDGGSLPIIGSYLPNNGTNYQDYTGHFGGTSAATPQVAGIAALILSLNSNLTQQQVADAITRTASGNGLRNNQTGYGLVNAMGAVGRAYLNNVSLTGPDRPYPYTSVSYGVSNMPSGVTFNNWVITPSTYAAPVTTNSNLNITFNNPGTYTLTARFRLSNGTIIELPKSVSVPDVTPIIHANVMNGYANPGAPVRFEVYNSHPTGTYQWRVNGMNVNNPSPYPNIYETVITFGWDSYMTVDCRVYLNGIWSNWSIPWKLHQ